MKKGAIGGAAAVAGVSFFLIFFFVYFPLSLLFCNNLIGSAVAAGHYLGLGWAAAFEKFIPAGFQMNAKWMQFSAFFSVFVASVSSLFLLVWGAKTGRFATGDGRKQKSGLMVVESRNFLRKILVQGAKKKEDLGAYLADNFPIFIGNEPRHFAFVGGSGAGKTNAMMPFLLSAMRDAKGSPVIHDPKGDFTANLLQFKPFLVAPWLKNSFRWDVAADVDTPARAAQFSANMVPQPEGGNAVFSLAARQVLTGVVVFLQNTKAGKWTLRDVCREIDGDASGENLERILKEHYPRALKSLSIDKTRASVLMNLSSYLAHIFTLAEAWENTEKSISFSQFLEHADKSKVRPLILQNNAAHEALSGCLFKAILDFMSGKILGEMTDVPANHARRIWFFLDETKALPPLECIERLLNQGRSKGVRVVLGCQNPFQISHWSKSADSDVWGNIHTLLIGNLAEPKSGEWAEKMFGEGYFQESLISYSADKRGGKGRNVQNVDKKYPIVSRDEFQALPQGTFYIRIKGTKYVPKFRFPYFADKKESVKLAANPYFKPITEEELRLRFEEKLIEAAVEAAASEQVAAAPPENKLARVEELRKKASEVEKDEERQSLLRQAAALYDEDKS